MDGVVDVVGIDGDVLEAGLPGAAVLLAADFDLEAVQRHLAIGGLDQKDVGQATAEDTQLELRRTGTEVVASEIGTAVAEDLEVANPNAADATAAFGAHSGRKRVWTAGPLVLAVSRRRSSAARFCSRYPCRPDMYGLAPSTE